MNRVTFEVQGHEVAVLEGPYLQDGVPTSEARAYAATLIGMFDEMRQAAAGKFLQLYNDTWREEEDPELDADGFMKRLVEPSIVLFDEPGNATIFFGDSDMFAGHSIQASVQDGVIEHMTLVG